MVDLIMSHQTSSATYPSINDFVTLSYLKTHGGTPPTPGNCKTELMISDFLENVVGDFVDERVDTVNTKLNHHSSITGTQVMFIASPSNIIPPVCI